MAKFNYDVSIRPVSNGVILSIGCKTLVFQDSDIPEMLVDIQSYLTGGRAEETKLARKYDLLEQPWGNGDAPPGNPLGYARKKLTNTNQTN